LEEKWEEEWGREGEVRERRWNEGGEGGRTKEVGITLYVHVFQVGWRIW